MNFEDYYFLVGFTTKFDKEFNNNSTNVYCTDCEYYTSDENIELIKKQNFEYNEYDKEKIKGLYIKKDFFKKKGLNIIEIDDYHFIPFFGYNENNLTLRNTNINNLKNICDNHFFSIGFNTLGEIKYNIQPYNKWEEMKNNTNNIIPGTYIKKYPESVYMNKGIVICVTEKNDYHKLVICLIQIIRYLNCYLPIEIFYGDNELNDNTINIFNSQKNVKCININNITKNFNFSGYQIKPFSLFYSSFEEVILLDADSIVFRNIEDLFYDRDYLENGHLFFSDQQNKKIHTHNTIKFINTNVNSNFSLNYSQYNNEQCSSLVVFNKKKNWYSLLGICGLNYNYKNTYKYLFGDKDTFWTGCYLFNQKFYFKERIGILNYPDKLKDLRIKYCEKHGGSRIIGNGDKIFLDDNDEPIHLNQFKMDTKNNDLLHNTSWNFYIWDNITIYENAKKKYTIDIENNIFKVIMKYHNFYLRLCNPNIKPPINLYRYQKPERLDVIKKALYESKMEDLNRIINSNNKNEEINKNSKIESNYIDNFTGENIKTENDDKEELLDIFIKECIDIKENLTFDSEEEKDNIEEEFEIEEEKDVVINVLEKENNSNIYEKSNKDSINAKKDNQIISKNIESNNSKIIESNNSKIIESNNLEITESDSMQDFFNVIDSNYKSLKKKILSLENQNNRLEKENIFLHSNIKDIAVDNESKKKENKQLKFLLGENKQVLNKQKNITRTNEKLLKKISVLNTEIDLLKNKLKNMKKNVNDEETVLIKDDDYIDNDSIDNDSIDNDLDINHKNLKFFNITNNIKKQFELNIIEITQIQKDVITHINSEDVSNYRNWDEILRDFSSFRNKKIKEIFIKDIDKSIKLLVNIAKEYTNY